MHIVHSFFISFNENHIFTILWYEKSEILVHRIYTRKIQNMGCTNHRLCPPCTNWLESARQCQALRRPSSYPPCNGTDRPCVDMRCRGEVCNLTKGALKKSLGVRLGPPYKGRVGDSCRIWKPQIVVGHHSVTRRWRRPTQHRAQPKVQPKKEVAQSADLKARSST